MMTVNQLLAQLAAVPTEKRDETKVDVFDANGESLSYLVLGVNDGRFEIRVWETKDLQLGGGLGRIVR